MPSPAKSHSGSAASDITWSSLSSMVSVGHLPPADTPAADVTWGSLASPFSISSPQQMPPSGTNLASGSFFEQSTSQAVVVSAPPQQGFPETNRSPSSMALTPSQKRQFEGTIQTPASKRPRLSQADEAPQQPHHLSPREPGNPHSYFFEGQDAACLPTLLQQSHTPTPVPNQMELDAMSDSWSFGTPVSTQNGKPKSNSGAKRLYESTPTHQSLPLVTAPRSRSQSDMSSIGTGTRSQNLPTFQDKVVSPHRSTTASTPQAKVVPQSSKGKPNALPLNEEIPFALLDAYIQTLPSVVEEYLTNQLKDEPEHALFEQIFAGYLLHAMTSHKDPERSLWVLSNPEDRPKSWISPLVSTGYPPTHFVALHELPEEDFTILIWGHCTLVSANAVHLWFTLYDSQGKISSLEQLKSYFPQVGKVLNNGFAPYYTVIEKTCRPPYWTNKLLSLSKRELGLLFCQLISSVVLDLPLDKELLKQGPPVGPIWPASALEQNIQVLLGQIRDKELCLDNLTKEESELPQCVHLHGAPPYHAALPSMDNIAYSQGQAEVEDCGETNWYIKAGNVISYRYTTPSDFSAPHTPPPRPSLVPTASSIHTHQDQTIESARDIFLKALAHRHPSRVAYWRQIKACNPSNECISLITLHLWFSALQFVPSCDVFYVDHILAARLMALYENDPLNLTAHDIPELFDRHTLWPTMGPKVHVVVLTRVNDITGQGVNEWVILDFTVESGRVMEMDVLLPPFEAFDVDIFAQFGSSIIGALNCILPRPRLVQHSSAVPQTLRSIVLPQPHTADSLLITIIAHFCGKLLNQPVRSVDIGIFRQSVCYFYSDALRSREVNSSFPWHGLTDSDGTLLTTKSSHIVNKRRFSIASNQDGPPFEPFPRSRSHTVGVSTPGPEAPFFIELAQPNTTRPEGILVGTSGRSIQAFNKGALLGPYPSWPRSFSDRRLQTPDALSLDEFVDLVHSLGGPEHPDAQRFVLTLVHEEDFIKLDWLKDAYYPNAESLLSGFDTDSLTATFAEAPDFLRPGNFVPYPKRENSLLFKNELRVLFEGNPIDLHSCPNICFMTFGDNGRFRFIVFFPRKRGKRDRQQRLWRQMPKEQEMIDWYCVFMTAMHMVSTQVPPEWHHAVEKTIEQLPTTYEMAKNLTSPKGAPRVFIARAIEPYILNRTLKVVRQLVNTTPKYAEYRDYFFHLCGINLKLATQHIPGREDENPLSHAFQMNPFIDWCKVNPADIVADIGLAVNLHRPSAPEGYEKSTLLIRYSTFREMLRPGFRLPELNAYAHSLVVAGMHATATKDTQKGGIIKCQVYHKDYVLNYRDRDTSVGYNWTVDEALGIGKRDTFQSQMQGFQQNQQQAGSYGVRFELRLSAWAANRLMQSEPQAIVEQMVECEAILCHPTETVAAFKITLSRTWSAILRRQSQLPREIKQSPEVMLLASSLAYLLKGLVKKPDEMSSSQDMAKRLSLTLASKYHGLSFFRPGILDADCLRVDYIVGAHTFKILDHCNVIRPGGQTIKSSRLGRPAVQAPAFPLHLPSPPTTPLQPPGNGSSWSNDSTQFVKTLITIRLPRIMWSYFPEGRKAPGDMAIRLRERPLRRSDWSKVVEPLNDLVSVSGKFMESFDRLFPPDWKVVSPPDGDFKKYDRDFLQRIRDHINSKGPDSRSRYSDQLRREIRMLVLARFDYLPVMHAHKMWTFKQGGQGNRTYRVGLRSEEP